ncbi:MAG: glycoside hydrolase [Bacteroidota bacterium]|nr:glycoside hydrolase [Bacteroidota bacterium]
MMDRIRIKVLEMKYMFALVMMNLLFVTSLNAQNNPIRKIKADLKQIEGQKINVFNECVGAGRANEGLRADWQQQLAMVQKEIGFRYIRFHGLLHDDMGVYREDKEGNVSYNWQYIDKLFDYLLSIKVRPFVELSFMPADLASGTKTVFWWKSNVTKPKSYAKWDALIANLVTHWQERYGKDEVAKWYFEVWNEPDLKGFYDGTQDDYFELYHHTAKAVKSVSHDYRVGGPATSATKWIADFLSYCASQKLPVDFVSTHDYGTNSVLDEFGTKKQKLKSNFDTIAQNVKRVRNLINASPYKEAELHFTEWNTSPSSRDPMHDTYQNATYVLNTLKKTGTACNSMSYWTFTDIFEEAGPALTPFHGGFGLLNLQNIKKPTYYAYKFMNELGSTMLKNEDNSSYICTSNQKDVQALIWNYTFTDTGSNFNQGYFIKEQPSTICQNAELEISNMQNGTYRVEIYKVGYHQNDPFTGYLEMGRPAQLTLKQEAEIKKLSTGLPADVDNIVINNGSFKKRIPLRNNDIIFIKLIKKN